MRLWVVRFLPVLLVAFVFFVFFAVSRAINKGVEAVTKQVHMIEDIISVSELTQKQFEALEKITIQDEKGFKYVKASLHECAFNQTFITSKSNHITTDEDREAIQKVLRKY